MKKDNINPAHYKGSPAGIEVIDVTEHLPFNIGNSIKYLLRAGLKNDYVEDLTKSVWYIQREIKRFKKYKTFFKWEAQCKIKSKRRLPKER